MYLGSLAGLLALAAWILVRGLRRESRLLAGLGITLAAATGLFFATLSFWGEMLWFEALGYGGRFWTAVAADAGFIAAGALVAGAATWSLCFRLRPRRVRLGATGFGILVGGLWGRGAWQVILRFVHRVPAGVSEPILGLDAGFYLFTLPFLDVLYGLAFTVAGIAVVAAVAAAVLAAGREEGTVIEMRGVRGLTVHPASRSVAGVALAGLLPGLVAFGLVLAVGRLLAIPHLLYSSWGVVAGPGWTDVHVRIPALLAVAAVTGAASLALLSRRLRERFGRWALRLGAPARLVQIAALAPPVALVALSWALGLAVVPGTIQSFWVEPNEISFEKPFIAHNIELTNRAFGLDRIEAREFPASGTLDARTIRDNRNLLRETRLWDWRALDAVYRQFQEIRLYYEFVDVDTDRYHVGDAYRQVMVSAREMEVDNLPDQSQTFVNRRFKYTHGYGLTMAPVAEFTSQGLPRLLVKDLPPRSSSPDLAVERPQIYYGELTDSHAYVNTTEEEFDHPRGDENATIHYSGTGGVELSNLWRKLVFGWMFDGTRFFLSEYPTPASRVMFHRRIRDRVARVAPFLTLDDDPYVVLVDGRLYWIVDAYTTSRYFPYSEAFSSREVIELDEGGTTRRLAGRVVPRFEGVNYVRNAVKVVVDAFDGSVDLYVFDPDDPLIQAWQGIFPDLFRPADAMPAGLRRHVRYPSDLYLAQGLMYAKYHMTDPEVFYNQEDLWVRATEKYHAQVQPVAPYFVMWKPPEGDAAAEHEVEFTTILPFTPKNKQLVIGWLAGLSDGTSYGRLLAYKFPKDQSVLGPQQVEAKIDQDRVLSQRLTLWDQRGSSVIRGNVLAIPIDRSLLYVEPIYLQAETAAYPELRMVVVMHGDDLAYGETLEEALERLVGGDVGELGVVARPEVARGPGGPGEQAGPGPGGGEATERPGRGDSDLAAQANDAFERYLELQAERRFSEAARELERLGRLLEELAGRSDSERGEAAPATEPTARPQPPSRQDGPAGPPSPAHSPHPAGW